MAEESKFNINENINSFSDSLETGENNIFNQFEAEYQVFTIKNLKKIPQIAEYCTKDQIQAIEVISHVLPFKTNNYVVNKLINWENIPHDSIFILNFPQKEILRPHHYNLMKKTLERGNNQDEINRVSNKIRMELNPQPAGQKTHNVPHLNGFPLPGMQHKYKETVLFFPIQGQTCHAYCSFCFRWPQFVGIKELRFANKQAEHLVEYVQEHEEITDILFTGGDPMVMKSRVFRGYIEPLLEAKIPHLRTIRIGTKSLSYWPYKYITDPDSEDLLSLFSEIIENDIHLAIMAHFNHPRELETNEIKLAINAIRSTGAQIRTQSPILKNINANENIWAEMWKKQVKLGLIPYYMFIVRDTGARHYFELPLVKAWEIFRKAYQKVSGICRTVRGPVMSAFPGKVQVLGVTEIEKEKCFVLRFIQGRKPEWVGKPFLAKYDEKAGWLDELTPAFGQKSFFYKNPV